MATNELLTIDMITYKGLSILKNNLVLGGLVNRSFDGSFAKSGAKIGDTLNIRMPPRYIGREGDALAPEATVESKIPLKLDYLFGVDLEFGSVERTLSLDNYADRVLAPAIATICNRIDNRIAQVAYPKIYNAVGTPGTTPATVSVYLDAGVKLDNEAAPMDDKRYLVTTPQMQATLLPVTAAYFNPNGALSEQYKKGRFGKGVLGFDWYMSQNLPTHTVATHAGTPLTNGANQTGSSLITDGWSSGAVTLNKGDIFTIEGVYGVNPQSRQSTGVLKQFVVTNDPSISDTSGDMTISISPSIIPSGQFQTTNSAAADGAAITILGSTGRVHPMGLAFHRDAIVVGTADLEMVSGVHECARASDPDSGLSIRMITAYDIQTNKMYTRMETLMGIAVPRPELACRVVA